MAPRKIIKFKKIDSTSSLDLSTQIIERRIMESTIFIPAAQIVNQIFSLQNKTLRSHVPLHFHFPIGNRIPLIIDNPTIKFQHVN